MAAELGDVKMGTHTLEEIKVKTDKLLAPAAV